MTSRRCDKVLIVTGSMITAQDKSLWHAFKKQLESFRASSGAWLDIRTKIMIAEDVLAHRLYRKSRAYRRSSERDVIEPFFASGRTYHSPELTEVVLATGLAAEGIEFETASYSELYANRRLRRRLLKECGCVFASTTLLRDFSEFKPLIKMLKEKNNRIVVGGALTTMLPQDAEGRYEDIDLLAVGYGELLIPNIANWVKSNYTDLAVPEGGRIEKRKTHSVLFSGVPKTKDLDFLPRPDWSLMERHHKRSFSMVYYESVRGCPYRCAFCNYPFLFSDNKFRYKSAEKIAEDWEFYAKAGAEYITCLDSLFTMPKRRLLKLCQILIERNIKIKWICYARADDLTDIEVCKAMKAAGCHQLQIGLESGSQEILDNMVKQCTVEKNIEALLNCRKVGITTAVTAMMGFPGETEDTVEETIELFRKTKPDFYYAAAFNTRFELMPIMKPERAKVFGLQTQKGGSSSIPYWRHDTMCSTEVCSHLEKFDRVMFEEGLSLNSALFFDGMLGYNSKDRDTLLNFQRQAYASRGPIYKKIFSRLEGWAQRRLDADVERVFGTTTEETPLESFTGGNSNKRDSESKPTLCIIE